MAGLARKNRYGKVVSHVFFLPLSVLPFYLILFPSVHFLTLEVVFLSEDFFF